MRIHVCHVLEATVAGVRRHAVDLVEHAPADAVATSLIYSRRRADAAFEAALPRMAQRARLIEIDMTPTLTPVADLVSAYRIASALRSLRPEVLHVHSGKGGLLGRLGHVLARSRTRVVYTPNASPFRLGRSYSAAERLLSRVTDAIVAVSASERHELVTAGVAGAHRVHVIESGIDLSEFSTSAQERHEMRRRLGIRDDEFLIGTAGRIAEQKAPLDFARAAAVVLRDRPKARFLWIGDGEMRGALEAEVARLGISGSVQVSGFMPSIRAHLNALDAFCLLSHYESFGYVTVEAMSVGLPVVATRVAGSSDVVVHGETGLLCASGDPAEAGACLLALIGDPSRAHRMADAGQARARTRYSVDRMVQQTVALYRELVPRPS